MKHDYIVTGKLLGLTMLSLILGLFTMPYAYKLVGVEEMSEVNPIAYGVSILIVLLISAFFWMKMMKKFSPKTILIVFSIGIGLLCSKVVALFLPSLYFHSSDWIAIGTRFVVTWFFAHIYYNMVTIMQESWANTRKLNPLNNLFMIILLPVAAAILANGLSVAVSMSLLFAVGIYDAWAVWRSKTMIKMAKYFIKQRMIPGLGITKATKKEGYALLGGGDIFFIVLVATTMYPLSAAGAGILTVTMFASLVYLFAISAEKKFYPAIPFIFVGAVIGLIIIFFMVNGFSDIGPGLIQYGKCLSSSLCIIGGPL